MIELKVVCPCGTKYAFDVEPIDGQIPEAVACPACGRDGSEIANAQLASRLAEASSAPSSARPALRVSRPAAEPPPPRFQPPPAPAAPPKKVATIPSTEPSLALGIVGAVVGGLAGMAIWYGVMRYTGVSVGWIAWGVGAATGLCTRFVGRDANHLFGIIAAIVAVVAILGGKYLAVSHRLDMEIAKFVQGSYEEDVARARLVADAKSDADLRKALVEMAKNDEEDISEQDITDEDLKEFKDDELPELRDLAGGKIDRTTYERRMVALAREFIPMSEVFKASVNWFTGLWVLLGVGSAWKLATGDE